MPTLTDIAQARLEVISFFLFAYFVLSWVYQRLWNSLARDLPRLPRLSYRGAVSALAVCGLFAYVVLTMISGARELLTPGAWARVGAMYEIREPERDPKPWLDSARRESLERVRAALWKYAEEHGDALPASRKEAGFPPGTWRSIDPNGLSLIYLPGAKRDVGHEILVYEPGPFGATRWVLLSDGQIVRMKAEELAERLRTIIDTPPKPREGGA